MTKEEIGEKLKAKRISCGMTQQEVAEKLGRKQPIVGHWETGYSQPDANTLFMLCDIYGTTVDDVFGFTPKENFSKSEHEHIKKYRFISTHSPDGASVVDTVLDREHSIAEQLAEQKTLIEKLEDPIHQENLHTTEARAINYYYRLASAGTGQIIFDMPPTKRIEIPNIPEYRKADYAIGVNGSSMEPVFHDGDTLLIEMTEEIESGEIGIFLVDGECFVKKLGNGELVSLNPEAKNIPLNESSRCKGRVIAKL